MQTAHQDEPERSWSNGRGANPRAGPWELESVVGLSAGFRSWLPRLLTVSTDPESRLSAS